MPVPDLNNTYGAMLIGTFFAIFFQGMLSVQAYIYYESFPEDSRKVKWMVAILWTLDLVHLILICQTNYYYLISNWGNDNALLFSTQELDLHLLFIGASSIICQTFFLHRVWQFSEKNCILTGTLAAACLAALALDILITVQLSSDHSVSAYRLVMREIEILAVFSLGAATDLFLAILLVRYLHLSRTSFERTNFVLNRIIQYTVATGLATSLLALGCVAAYLISRDGFVFIAMHFSLGRMYTNALLATLNSRRNLRTALKPMFNSWEDTPDSRPLSVFVVTETTSSPDYALNDPSDKHTASG
ncbi:hypothetical protein B0H11DRAFT_2358579 [Mycena galericulata]|nr:hypothetical protein B0H11DRAFT_2358579 [Mycena galericulata]